MSDLPDLYLPAQMAGTLMDELAKRFVVHRDNPPPTTRIAETKPTMRQP